MVYDDATLSVDHFCEAGNHRFVLKLRVETNAAGSVTRWDELTDLTVRVPRGQDLMFGFECGSRRGRRGDVIAVVAKGTERPLRAWRIDTAARQFTVVSPGSVVCESLE